MRKMPPSACGDAGFASFGAEEGSATVVAVESGVDDEDFFRGGNAASLAAEAGLEIHGKVCIDNFLGGAAGAAAKHEVILPRLILGSGEIEVHILIVR